MDIQTKAIEMGQAQARAVASVVSEMRANVDAGIRNNALNLGIDAGGPVVAITAIAMAFGMAFMGMLGFGTITVIALKDQLPALALLVAAPPAAVLCIKQGRAAVAAIGN